MKEVTKQERKMTANSPWGDGYPLGGQLNGCPSIPKSVYSCSMPNQMLCSLTSSITLLQLCRWLVSSRDRKSDQLVCPELPECYNEKKRTWLWTEMWAMYLQENGCILGPHRGPVCLGRVWTDPWRCGLVWGTCHCWSLRPGTCSSHQSSTQECLTTKTYPKVIIKIRCYTCVVSG